MDKVPFLIWEPLQPFHPSQSPLLPFMLTAGKKKRKKEWAAFKGDHLFGILITRVSSSQRLLANVFGVCVGGFENVTTTSKALIFPRGTLFSLDLISDANRPAQWRWQENTQTLICWTYVWFAFCPGRWITLIPGAWKAEWVAAQGASDYGRHPAHRCMASLGNGAQPFIKIVRGVWSKRAKVEQRLAVQLRDYGD